MSNATDLFKRIHAISVNGLASINPMSDYCKPMWVNPKSLDTIIDLASEGRRLSEAPLTPAQEHADEMLELLRDMVNTGSIGIANGQRVRALFDKIDPPKPVTLDEAMCIIKRLAFIRGHREAAAQAEALMTDAEKLILRWTKETPH